MSEGIKAIHPITGKEVIIKAGPLVLKNSAGVIEARGIIFDEPTNWPAADGLVGLQDCHMCIHWTEGDDGKEYCLLPPGIELCLPYNAPCLKYEYKHKDSANGSPLTSPPEDLKDEPISEWILKNFKDNIVFVMNKSDHGEFYVYDGIKWEPDRKRKYQHFIIKAVKALIQELTKEAEAITPKFEEDKNGRQKPTEEYAKAVKRIHDTKKYLDYNKIRDLWRLIQGKVAIDNREFDTNYNLLNFRNGTFELDTWTFRPHRPEDMLTKVMPVDYFEGVDSPKLKSEVVRSFKDQAEQNFIKVMFGHTLGRHPEKRTWHLTGPGDTGKTTLLNAIMKVLGDDGITGYAAPLGSDTFTASKARQATRNDLLMAKNCCIIGIDEQKTDERQDTNTVKAWTGGSKVNIRGLYDTNQAFPPCAALFDTSNRLPRIDATDSGIVNRQVVIPFTEVVTKKIPNYWDVLYNEEATGILNWLLEGFKEYREYGLPELPKRFMDTTTEYIMANNVTERFLRQNCVIGDHNRCRVTWIGFHNSFKNFCREYENIDEKYMPGKDKILDILKQKNIILNDKKTRIGKETFRHVLMGVRLKTLEEEYIEELEAFKEDSDNMEWLYSDISKIIEKTANKEVTMNDLHAELKAVPGEIIEQALNQMLSKNLIVKTGPREFGLPEPLKISDNRK